MPQVSVQNRNDSPAPSSTVDYAIFGVSTNSSLSGFTANNKTDDLFSVPPTSSQPAVSVFDRKEEPSNTFDRADSDDFGDFASTSESVSAPEPSSTAHSHLDIFQSSTSTNVSFSGSSNLQGMFQSDTSLALTPSVSPRMEVSAPQTLNHQNMFQSNTSAGLTSATSTISNLMQSDLFSSVNSFKVNDSSTETVSSISKPILATENHVSSIQGNSSFSPVENNHDDFDEFDDFQTAVPESTPAVSTNLASSFPQLDKTSQQAYVPGSLTNENADIVYSVAIFSNPIKVENTTKSNVSEFDNLINKSLSGKATKSNVKSLFKPALKPSIPSMKSTAIPSEKAADWGSLDLGNAFQIPDQEEDDDFGDFSSKVPETATAPQNDIFNMAASLPSVSHSSESPTDDLFSLFSSSKPSGRYDKVPYISEGTQDPAEMKVGITDLLGITTPKPEPKKESNSILDMFGSNNLASVNQGKKSEPTDQDWTDFTTTPVAVSDHSIKFNVPAIDLVPPVKTNPSNLNMAKIPSIYKDIIAFCNTPSGIIDVGKIYEILLTDKFKVVALQPLMSQCKMMGNPTAKDLVDLLGIVALKQKGFPTPSKYELNYQKLSIPSINMSVLKKNKSNQKESKSEQPTLLSFVSQDAEKKVPALAPVFDFGMSSTKDLSCAPFAGAPTNNNGMLPTDSSADNDNDDWGDFGEVSEPAKSTNFSWDNNQVTDFAPSTKSSPVIDLLNMPIAVSTKSNPVVNLLNMPIVPPVPTSSLTVSLPKPRSAAPLKLDEPPPLSDEDDEDWADFAHPAHKWDIDPDHIEEQAVNNTASKNRWGTISISSDKGTGIDNYHDKDYSHVTVEDVEDTKAEQPNFFAANLSSISVAKVDVAMSDIRSKFDVPSPATTFETDVPVNISNKDKLVFEEEVVEETATKEKVSQKDLDKLASPDADLGQFVSPFADLTDSNPQPFDAVFMKSVEKKKFDNVFVISAGAFDSGNNKDESAASNFDSPFADFNNNTAKAITESGDFGDFTTSGDAGTGEKDSQEPESFVPAFADFGSPSDDEDEFADFCGTAEDNDSTKDTLTESLKLTNLPKKDLDGFWNDMVDGLGSKTDSVPVFDLGEEAPKKVSKPVDVTAFVPTVQHPVSYDALKGESFDNEEDRIGAWSKSLSMILTILIHCQSLLGTSKVPSVKQEVVDSEKGKLYLDCCTEVFRVACRISLAGAFDDGIVEIFKEIKHTWTLISEMLDDSIDLPTIRDFNIRPAKTEDEFSGRNCGICLLDTGVESKTSKLQYNGVFYHVTCANFWVNSVSPLLPDLNSKLEAPLL